MSAIAAGATAMESLSSRRTWIEIIRPAPRARRGPSLSSRRTWIEMVMLRSVDASMCRSPHGERGLKWQQHDGDAHERASLSSRRTWIEMSSPAGTPTSSRSRSPHGERGLKFEALRACRHGCGGRSPHGERGLKSNVTTGHTAQASRSPHGERGLKWQITGVIGQTGLSLSSRRTWIEILAYPESIMRDAASLSSRRTWIEISTISY